jgi:hypothetical protein
LGLVAASVAAQCVDAHPQPPHNFDNLSFLLDPLSKSEFLSINSINSIINYHGLKTRNKKADFRQVERWQNPC